MRLAWAVPMTLAAALVACEPAPPPFHGLPFVENDFDAARSRAQQANVPLFVEVWAPW